MGESIRSGLLSSLPVSVDGLVVRLCERSDYDVLAGWPPYAWPFDVFNLHFASMSRVELDRLHEERAGQGDRITLVVDHGENHAIG